MKAPLLALALLAPLAACDSDPVDDVAPTLTARVVADPELSTLAAAVVEADLDDDLAGPGPFTVFAPTDAAFQALLTALDATPAQLLARDDLGAILALHVVAGSAVRAGQLQAGQTIPTLNGQTLTVVATAGGGFGLDTDDPGAEPDAVIVETDVPASNGVLHKLDAVLLPAAR